MSSSEDLRTLSKEQIRDRLHLLTEQEFAVSTRRRELHGEIDALRRELVNRLRDEGVDVITGEDTLGPGPSGSREPRRPKPQLGSDGAAVAEPPHNETAT